MCEERIREETTAILLRQTPPSRKMQLTGTRMLSAARERC